MDQGNHKKTVFACIILLILLGIIIWIFYPRSHTPANNPDLSSNGFSPFDRTELNTSSEVQNITYARTASTSSAVRPATSQYTSAPYTPARAPSPTPSSFYQNQIPRTAFSFPPARSSQPAESQEPDTSGYKYDTQGQLISYSTSTQSQTSKGTSGTETKTSIIDLDRQIFGYVSGLGWTQLLGEQGTQIFNMLYATTPQGTTNATLGKLVGIGGSGGGGGGMGGGGFGGGGGGAAQTFGGRVSRVTYCTCSASSMLDIDDVRGQTTSLIYQPGASRLYSDFNVNGTGQNVLGDYTAGGQCMVYHGEDCSSEGSPSGTITQIGTSAQ